MLDDTTPSARPRRDTHFTFFLNDTATTEIYTLSLHDALPISDYFKQSRAYVIVQIFRRKLLLPGLGKASVHLGGKLVDGIGGDRVRQHEILSSHLIAHAAESRICILIMWLKPIAEGAPQHAGGSARRTAFHDVVLAIEEIRRIPAIEGEWLEALEGREQSRSPFPTIAEQVSHTKGALRLRKSANRSWIPSLEIKIPQLVAWRCATPRVRIFSLVLRTISCAVPLRFRWQLLTGPTCIGARLSVTHIYGPIWRQREFIEHRAQEPLTVFATPEDWMCDVLLRLPIPVGIRPVVSMIVAAPCHELQKLTVRNFVLVDRERRHFQ